MAALTGNPTGYGEGLYTNNLLNLVKNFVIIGSTTLENEALSSKLTGLDLTYAEIENDVIHTEAIVHASHDANNQAYFDCIVPYTLNLEKYVFAIGLIAIEDGVKKLVDWTVVNKFYQTTQVGGTYKYLVGVANENGGVIFKDTDYITQTELNEKFTECCNGNDYLTEAEINEKLEIYSKIDENHVVDTSSGVDVDFILPENSADGYAVAIEYTDVNRTALIKVDSAGVETITDVEKGVDTANIGKPSIVVFTFNATTKNWNWRI